VRGPLGGALFGSHVNLSSLVKGQPETIVVDIRNEADGAGAGFGLRLRHFLEARADALFQSAADGRLKEIIYTDRYVFSPLSALLVAELTSAFARRAEATVIVRTRSASRSVHTTPPWQVQHDWTTQADRFAVLDKLLSRASDGPRVNLDDTTPHRRTLVLKWERGGLEITFDQGVGPWQPSERCRFDFGKSADEQVLALLKQPIRLRIGASTFVVIRRIVPLETTH
jgi:DEAD/DEAH box helicase domain-containing protein